MSGRALDLNQSSAYDLNPCARDWPAVTGAFLLGGGASWSVQRKQTFRFVPERADQSTLFIRE